MTQQLPPGQGPIDPRGAFAPAPSPGGYAPMPPRPGGLGGPGGPWLFPPPPPKRSFLKIVLLIVLIVALTLSVLINIAQLSSSVSSPSTAKETVLVQGDSSSKIAVVPIDGLIDDGSATKFDRLLTDVEKDSLVKALVVEINTPGGSASASDEMYHRLNLFKKAMADANRKCPVVISMKGMATSGGYYVSCAGEYVFAEPGCLTGNIGVLFPRFNLSKLCDKYGVDENTLTATTKGHSYKNAGSMFQPPNPEDEAYLQGLVDDIFAQFKNAVQTGRKTKLNDAKGDVFSGKAFIAQDALDRGLIDQIDYPDAAYDKAASMAGVSNKTVVKYTEPVSILGTLFGETGIRPPQASGSNSVAIDGVNVDPRTIQDLIISHPMLLWRGN